MLFRSGNNDAGGEIMNVFGVGKMIICSNFGAYLEGCRCYIGTRVPNNSINALVQANI